MAAVEMLSSNCEHPFAKVWWSIDSKVDPRWQMSNPVLMLKYLQYVNISEVRLNVF